MPLDNLFNDDSELGSEFNFDLDLILSEEQGDE